MANKSISLNSATTLVKKATLEQNVLIVNSRALGNKIGHWADKSAETLSFFTFYHPHISYLIERLNIGGPELLLKANTSEKIDEYTPDFPQHGDKPTDDEGATFNNYKPGSTPAPVTPLISTPADTNKTSYYKENIDFCFDGAYSKYNWELFYHVPLFIATRLSKNGKYEEAMKWFHYIFNPTTNLPDDGTNKRYWEFLPFQTTKVENLEEMIRNLPAKPEDDPGITKWLSDPLNPFIVARLRIGPFMKNVVMKYIDNLLAWGDDLYRMNTIESINEATQLYIIAAHILGPKPQKIPSRGNVAVQTYNSLKGDLNAFGDAVKEMENIFPNSGNIFMPTSPDAEFSGSLLNIGSALYFCIPANNDLLQYWATVGDRLFNIRHCKNIEGVDQVLSLFAPKIDPALLVKARAQGLSIGSILADLNSPSPFYRFNYLLQKANEYCNEVKSLAAALLSALEKKDAEELSRIRASQEIGLLDMITGVKERQVLEAKAAREGLLENRKTLEARMKYYRDMLGLSAVILPPPPVIENDLTADSSLPAPLRLGEIIPDVDVKLSDSDERGVKLIPKEKQEFDSMDSALNYQISAGALETAASIFHMLPGITIDAKFWGIGAGTAYGLYQVGNAMSAIAKGLQIGATIENANASKAAKFASYIRREQEWAQQANMAAREIVQIDRQITASDIRIQIATKELINHKQQLINSQKIEQKLQDKFSNTELYTWMKDQLYDTFKQTYQLAYDMAKKAEKSYRFELGKTDSSFIQYGYWDSTYQGLSSGDKLQLALKQMEKSYIEENRREFELIKYVSLVQLNSLALIQLKETGTCNVDLPEEIFDLDYPGHYFRRIKSVSISIPCISGPYTTINSTLRLMRNSIRFNTNGGTQYEHNNEDGFLTDDEDRFVENNIPFNAIATSSAQNDSGVFELNFRDERYLPFEGAGVISSWKLELNGKYTDPEDTSTILDLSQFDYDSVSDIIFHVKYTAREDAGKFKSNSIIHLKQYINPPVVNGNEPFMRMFSIRHEFANEWFNFLNQIDQNRNQILSINLDPNRFPFFTTSKKISIARIIVLAKSTEAQLISKGIGLLTPVEIKALDDPPNPHRDPGLIFEDNFGNIQSMAPIISKELLQTSFDFSQDHVGTGQFMIINSQKNGFLLSKETFGDLMLIVYYRLTD